MPEAERPRRHRRLAFATAALFVAGIQPAFAVDGVGEINQTCALATGCFAGDTPGFPVAIRSGGSYRLTGDLDLRVVPNAHEATAIDIQTSEAGGATVTLDLNGFALIGPVVCDGNGQNCAPAGGTGTGIDAAGNLDVVRLRNGFIRGMGDRGASINRGVVEDVFFSSNGGQGLVGGTIVGMIAIDRVVAARNGGSGIQIENGRVSHSTSRDNGGHGIVADSGLIADNYVRTNEGHGIAGGGAMVVRNDVVENDGSGLYSTSGAHFSENSFVNNGGGNLGGTPIPFGVNFCFPACP